MNLSWILIINGVYDIICGVNILLFHNAISNWHPSMFRDGLPDPQTRRILAYWILTNGVVRLYTGLVGDHHIQIIAAMTYFTEAGCFSYENFVAGTLVEYKAGFVTITSLILGVILIMNHYRK
jgi:hypothetical protein